VSYLLNSDNKVQEGYNIDKVFVTLDVLWNRVHQLYKNISMLFLFPHLMHHVMVSLQQSKITLQNYYINNTSITQPTLSFYL